jgi:hypothetical protein
LQFFQQNEKTELSRHAGGIMHANLQRSKQGMALATTFLWTLRNPIDRAISTYRYLHPGNCGGDLEAMDGMFGPSIHFLQQQSLGARLFHLFSNHGGLGARSFLQAINIQRVAKELDGRWHKSQYPESRRQ